MAENPLAPGPLAPRPVSNPSTSTPLTQVKTPYEKALEEQKKGRKNKKEMPGDSVRNPAQGKEGLAPGKFYINPQTGDIMQVVGPGFLDSVVVRAEFSAQAAAGGNVYDDLTAKLSEAKIAYEPFDPVKRPSGLDEPKTVLYNGKQLSKKELKKIVDDLQKQVDKISGAASPLEEKANALREEVAQDEAYEKGNAPGKRLTPAERQKKSAQAESLENQATQIRSTGRTSVKTVDTKPATSPPRPETKPVSKPVVVPQASKPVIGKEVTSAADFRRFEEMGVTAPNTTPQPTPTPAGGGTTTSGGGTLGGGKGGKGKKPKAAPDWASIVQQEFGSLWDVYNGNADVKAVLDQSVKEGWFNDETKLSAQLQNTGWYRTTERSARQFAIRNSTDPASVEDEIVTGMEDLRQSALANGFTFDDMTLRRLSTDKIKYGWSAQQTTSAIGSEAVAQAQGRGAQGLSDLRSGFVGQNLRKIAKSYAQKPSETQLDSFINDIMTGKKTTQQFTDLMRNGAKTQFRSLASAIDQGQDVETAMYGYQQAAQSTLGNVIDTSTIDWTSDKWNKALNFRDEKTGEYRQMDLWEWNKYLRKLPEWQQTDEAKQTYQNVAYALAQGFGKTA